MAKTLKDLKAKLGELQGPEDNTVATKNFYRKHKTVKHPDPAGNGDDVFKASNVRTVNRSPDHGYNPGEDAAVYEDVGGYSDIDVKRNEQRKKAVMVAKVKRRVVDDEGFKRDDKPRWDSAKKEVEAGTQASSRKGLAITSSEKARRTRAESFSNVDTVLGGRAGLEQRMAKMAKDKKDQKKNQLMKAFRAYWGPDAQPKMESYDPKISEIFAHLSEENKELFLKVLGEEYGYERIAEAFGLTEEE